MNEEMKFKPYIHKELPESEGGGFVDSDAADAYARARYKAAIEEDAEGAEIARGLVNPEQAMDKPEIKKSVINKLHEEAIEMDRKLMKTIEDAKIALEKKQTFVDKHPEGWTIKEGRDYHGSLNPWEPISYPSHYIEGIQVGKRTSYRRSKLGTSIHEREIGPLAQNEVYVKYLLKENYPLAFASPKLRADRTIVEFAIDVNGENIRYAADEFRNDKELALRAVKQNGAAILWIGEKLKKDKDILATFKSIYGKDAPAIVFETNIIHDEQE